MKTPSARFSIVQKAIAETRERLDELPRTPEVMDLYDWAKTFERESARWVAHPPDDERKREVLEQVLALTLRVMQIAREAPK
jgi:hypothetical protein